jgi:hypothetical protein
VVKKALWLWLMLLALLLASCGGGGRAGYTAEQQTVDGITIKLEKPDKLALLQNYELFVTLADASGQPIDGATVFMEQDMAAMPMTANQPLGEPLGKGQYKISGVFSMDGEWKLVVHATIAGKDHTAAFQQVVSPQQ